MPGFAPIELVRASFECYGPPDVFLYNHYPIGNIEDYQKLCEEHGCEFFDSLGDRGLAGSLNFWIESKNVTGFIATRDPDAAGEPEGWQDALEKVLSGDPSIATAALNLFVTEPHDKKHEVINGIHVFQMPNLEAYSVAGWNLANMPRLFETISPYSRGFECRMREIVKGRTVYLRDYWNVPDPNDLRLAKYRDRRYNEWQKQHYSGLDISFAEWLKK